MRKIMIARYELEQTATIEAETTVGDRTFHVFVTHLGNGGPMAQQEAILREVEGQENIILLGDLSSTLIAISTG